MMRMFVPTGVLALLFPLAAVTAPAEPYCLPVVLDPNLKAEAALPRNQFPALGAKAIGVLNGKMTQVIGHEGRYLSDATAYGFGVDRGSLRYVLLQDRTLHGQEFQLIPVGTIPLGQPGAKEEKYFDLVHANPKTFRPWNVKGTYALVEVEVNDGKASPERADRFVATKVTQLDRTAAYPIDMVKAMKRVTNCSNAYFSSHAKFLYDKMNESQVLALGAKKPTGPVESKRLLLPSWLTKEDGLEVKVYYDRTNGDYQYGTGMPPQPGLPKPQGVRFGRQFGLRFVTVYRFDKTGRMTDRRVSPVETFHVDLPPPPAVRPGGPRS